MIVREINLATYKHERYFTFDLDDGKDFCYRSRMSSNAFFHGSKEGKPRPNRSATHLYVSDHLGETYAQKRLAEDQAMFGPIPVLTPSNIWEFYQLVGYDYRKKKWI